MYVVKVPGINGLGKTKGCEGAGNAIIAMLREIYSNEGGKSVQKENFDLEEIHLDNSDLILSNKLIYKNSFECFEEQPKTIFLGGDHSVSYSIARAFFDSCDNSGKEPCLIVFDAHPDLMTPMKVESGDSSHTTPMCCKEPTHEEWLSTLIDDGFPSENVLLVGVRNSWKDELDFIKKKKIKVIDCDKILLDIEGACDTITEFVQGRELYVSIDMDVIDPAFAPATSYSNEIGGLTSRQFLYLIKRINKIKTLRGVDIVEINSKLDEEKFNGMTIKLGAKILSELL